LWEFLQQVEQKEVTTEENEESANEVAKDNNVENKGNITFNINFTKLYANEV